MTCADVRLSLGAEPHAMTDALDTHLRECAACAVYRREMIQLDQQIQAALGWGTEDSSP
jgi:hypothetical protein